MPDLVLEERDALHEGLGAGRAPRDVDVDGDDVVDAPEDVVRVKVKAASYGAIMHELPVSEKVVMSFYLDIVHSLHSSGNN